MRMVDKKPPLIERPPFWSLDDQSSFTGIGPLMDVDTAMLIYQLEDQRLYTATEAIATKYPKGHPLHKKMFYRLCTFLTYVQLTKEPDHEVERGSGRRAKKSSRGPRRKRTIKKYYGATLKNYLTPKNYYRAQMLSALPGLLRGIALAKEAAGEPAQPVATSLSANKLPLAGLVSPARVGRRDVPIAVGENRVPAAIDSGHVGRGKTEWRPRFKHLMMTALVSLLLTAATAVVIKPPERTYEILRTRGIRAAVNYALASKEQGQSAFFSTAWLDYRDKNLTRAEQKAHMLLSDEGLTTKTRGDCHYLLGYIKDSSGYHMGAVGYFTEAIKLYREASRPENLYHAFLGLAKAHAALGELEHADAALDEALQSYGESGGTENLALFFSYGARVKMGSGEFELAIDLAERSLAIHQEEGHMEGVSDAYSDLGLLHTLTGDLERGREYTMRAQTLIVSLTDMEKHVFNLVNFIALDRIEGRMPDPYTVDTVKSWIDQHRNKELEYFLNMVLSFEIPRG